MGRAEHKNKAQKLAAWLAEHSPRRTTGMCPNGCGHAYMVSTRGQSPLIAHLNTCKGRRKQIRSKIQINGAYGK